MPGYCERCGDEIIDPYSDEDTSNVRFCDDCGIVMESIQQDYESQFEDEDY